MTAFFSIRNLQRHLCHLDLQFASILQSIFILLSSQGFNNVPTTSTAQHYSACPTPLPCHCVKSEKIFCSFMRLHSLPYFMTFTGVWNKLDISENFLDHLPKDAFKGVRVRSLNLSRNTINSIDTQAFSGIIGLNYLDLSHNSLRTIPKMFSALPELHTLKLCYNQLKTFKFDTFENAKSLYELDLTGNDIESIPTTALMSIHGLRRLILRHNRLTKIDAYAFHDLPIEELDLGDNGAPLAIHEEAFCGLQPTILRSEPGVTDWTGMQTLLLDHNGLSSLNPCVTQLIWTLHTVDISGNPLYCNCDIFSLREFGTKTSFPGAQCAAPEKFAGNYITSVNNTRYSCPTSRTSQLCKRLCQSPPPAAYRGKSNKSSSISCHNVILGFLIHFYRVAL